MDRAPLPGRGQAHAPTLLRFGSVGHKAYRAGATRPSSVILSAAKDLSPGKAQFLRFAQDDSSAYIRADGACPRPSKGSLRLR